MYRLQFFSSVGEINQWAQWLNVGGRTVLLHWGFTCSLCRLTPSWTVRWNVTTAPLQHKHGFMTLDNVISCHIWGQTVYSRCADTYYRTVTLRAHCALTTSILCAALYSSWIQTAHFFVREHAHRRRGKLKSWKLSHFRCNVTVARDSRTLICQRVRAYRRWNGFFLPIVL